MSSIVTFYSYKGGVGRSMALANIAYELSRKGLKVLMVDWDLEAPGLERYFDNFEIQKNGEGLLPLLMEVQKGKSPKYIDYIWTININSNCSIDFLQSGRREGDKQYLKNLENFVWSDFFSKSKGGVYLEKIRLVWKRDYDIVLIDSRTGLSDTGGICTIFLPDIIIPMFTANYQSLYGVRDSILLIQEARQKLANARMPLTILPIPSRFGTRTEFKESQEWLKEFENVVGIFYTDWLPKWIEPKIILEKTKIPQIDYFSFGEKLAVVEEGINDPQGMGYIFSKIASLLASDFNDIESFVGEQYQEIKEKNIESNIKYKYDIFISYAYNDFSFDWISKIFLPILKHELSFYLSSFNIYLDRSEINIGHPWNETIEHSLMYSKLLIPIITPTYFESTYALRELMVFLERERITKKELIFPISLTKRKSDNNYYSLIDHLKYMDFTDTFSYSLKSMPRSAQSKMGQRIKVLVEGIVESLSNLPQISNEWPLMSLEEVQDKVNKIASYNPLVPPKF